MTASPARRCTHHVSFLFYLSRIESVQVPKLTPSTSARSARWRKQHTDQYDVPALPSVKRVFEPESKVVLTIISTLLIVSFELILSCCSAPLNNLWSSC